MLNVADWLDRLGVRYRATGNPDELQLDCPHCGKKGKAYINAASGLCICFSGKCDARGHIRWFLKPLGNVQTLRTKPVNIAKEKPKELPDKSILEFPKNSRPLDNSVIGCMARAYLNKRGVTEEEIKEYGFHYTSDGCVYFPVLDIDGDLVGWQGRRFYFAGQKADNPPLVSDQLFNMLNCSAAKRIAITEGPFDCLAVQRAMRKLRLDEDMDFGCIALLGHNVSPNQASVIASLQPDSIWLMLDGDEAGLNGARNAANALWKAGIEKVYDCTKPGDKDPDERELEDLAGAFGDAVLLKKTIGYFKKSRFSRNVLRA